MSATDGSVSAGRVGESGGSTAALLTVGSAEFSAELLTVWAVEISAEVWTGALSVEFEGNGVSKKVNTGSSALADDGLLPVPTRRVSVVPNGPVGVVYCFVDARWGMTFVSIQLGVRHAHARREYIYHASIV